jgi:serine/threonine protein kinase
MAVDEAELNALFTEAKDLEPRAQLAFIDRVTARDPELARELLSILDDNMVTALRTGGVKPAVVPISQRVEIPGYALKGRLGQGGMGTVYSAQDELTRRQVAIKVLEQRDEDSLGRFRAEATIMEQLDHPGIARVLATGDARSRPYIVMEHIKGVTLDAYVAMMTPTLAEKLTLFAAICDAVEHAHRCGVVHRDLKPKNVMVREDGEVAILDFGIARTDHSAGLTRDGDLLGTPLYMCPEQAMGKAIAVDARSDVYSLGVILFELISGGPPYDLRGKPLAVAMKTILTEPPKPLADPALDALCRGALAKQSAERTASAAALAAGVRAYLTP